MRAEQVRKSQVKDSSIPSKMKRTDFFCSLAAFIYATLMAGCSGGASNDAMESDVNGYFCKKCEEKFYTERDVYAENCPKCKTLDIVDMVGFVCRNDQQATLAPRGTDRTVCSKCEKVVNEMKLPREAELKSWGAVKQSRELVVRKR
jgi:hypothetical protein